MINPFNLDISKMKTMSDSLNAELEKTILEGEAGAGMVKAKATGTGSPKSTTIIAAVAPQNATMDPTPRSILPVRTHSSIPTARIITYPFCITRLLIFTGEAFFPPDRI